MKKKTNQTLRILRLEFMIRLLFLILFVLILFFVMVSIRNSMVLQWLYDDKLEIKVPCVYWFDSC